MKVFYRLSRRRRRSAYPVYSQTRAVFCCALMERQWGRVIGFGAKGYKASTDRLVNIYSTIPQVKGFVTELITVNFCPFCGEAIEICRVK